MNEMPKLPEKLLWFDAAGRKHTNDGYSALQMQAYAIEHVANVLKDKPGWDDVPEGALWLAFKQETQEWCWMFVGPGAMGDDFIARERRPVASKDTL